MPMRLLSILVWLVALVGQPAYAASAPALQSLEQQLAYLTASKPGDHGIAALDLRTGEMVGVRADERFPMASTVKIAIAANYLAQVEHGRRSLDDLIAGRTAAQLMAAMILHSNNQATDLLLRDLGGPKRVQAWLDQRNVVGVRIDRTIAGLLSSKRDLYDVRDSSTPRAMVALLRRIDNAELLQPSSRDYLLGLMARCQTGKNRIRGLLPAGTPVEHKTGTLSGLTSDVGFMTLPDGRRLAVAFFERNGSDRPTTIAQAARKIYDGFTAWLGNSYGVAFGTQ
jgi:beta-lactamase class A